MSALKVMSVTSSWLLRHSKLPVEVPFISQSAPRRAAQPVLRWAEPSARTFTWAALFSSHPEPGFSTEHRDGTERSCPGCVEQVVAGVPDAGSWQGRTRQSHHRIENLERKVMKQIESFLNQQVDTSNFKALLAGAEKAGLNDPKIESAIDAAQRAEFERIRNYAKGHPGDDFVQANQGLLQQEGLKVETWTAAGNASMTSFVWWALGGGVAFPGQIPLAFLFGAKGGPAWALSTFTSVIAGSFVVDPKKIVNSDEFRLEKTPIGWVKKGPCNFQLSEGGVGPAGGITISFYSSTGTYWGVLTGIAPGIGGASVSGEAELVWQGF
jgi:hypothetical protein